MRSTLNAEATATVLRRLHHRAGIEDAEAAARISACERSAGRRLSPAERYALYGNAPLAITPEVGRLLYVLVLAMRPRRVVEFGSSLGLSTIYLAAGLADSVSDGLLIATEVVGEKAQSAIEYLRQAELESLVEMRVGDACETLRTNVRAVDFVFLDGRNDLYLAVLQLLEPALADRALVVADLSDNDPALDGFLSHVRDRGNGYIASTISLDDGVEVCVRVCTDTEATATRGRARHGNSRQGDSAVAKSGPARATDAEC